MAMRGINIFDVLRWSQEAERARREHQRQRRGRPADKKAPATLPARRSGSTDAPGAAHEPEGEGE